MTTTTYVPQSEVLSTWEEELSISPSYAAIKEADAFLYDFGTMPAEGHRLYQSLITACEDILSQFRGRIEDLEDAYEALEGELCEPEIIAQAIELM